MNKFIILFITIILNVQLYAQDFSEIEKQGFIIIHASENYEASKKVANEAQKHLGYKLDLRNHIKNETLGLSLPKVVCEENGFEYPFYVQRGRAKDGNYISIEYTNIYNSFTEGFYIIVVANFPKTEKNKLKETLKFVKKHYESAYIKYTDIYMGCMH